MIKRGRAIKTLTASILGGAMLVAASMPASAEGGILPSGGPEFSANVALTTDYMFRGISQTQNDPAIQGGIDMTWGIFYLGTWASNVDFGVGDPADFEIDFYGGITPTWQNINFDLGVLFYVYPGVGSDGYDVVEGKLGISTTVFENLGVGFTGYFSDRNYQVYEFSAGYDFASKWWVFTPSVSGQIGFMETDGSFVGLDYTYWNAGLTLGFWDKPNMSIDIRYWDSDLNETGCTINGFNRTGCDARAVATLKASF